MAYVVKTRAPQLVFILMVDLNMCEPEYVLCVRPHPLAAALKIGRSNSEKELRSYFENLKLVFGNALHDYREFVLDDYTTPQP